MAGRGRGVPGPGAGAAALNVPARRRRVGPCVEQAYGYGGRKGSVSRSLREKPRIVIHNRSSYPQQRR